MLILGNISRFKLINKTNRSITKKIIVVKDNILLRRNEEGVTTIGLKQFLLNPNSLEL